jgi:hypothetical protein
MEFVLVMSVMEQVQPGMFAMALNKLWLPNVNIVPNALQRKICAVALVSLICTASPFHEQPLLANWPIVLQTIV